MVYSLQTRECIPKQLYEKLQRLLLLLEYFCLCFLAAFANVLEEVSLKLQKLSKMFRKVPFIWTSHFPKPLCHWLEKSHFLTPSGSVHLLSVPSPAGNQLAPHHESLVPLLGPWVCFICNTQARTLQ